MGLSYEEAREVLASRLSPEALAHCVGVAHTADLLARVYSQDAEAAKLAGLLHDWHRELEHDDLVRTAVEAGIEVSPEELHIPYLLHARTGALDVRRQFPGVSSEVVDAIERHTVGDPEMTALDKIVYLADMIEPCRDYPGVDDLRESVGTTSLDDLFANAYAQSVGHLVDRRKRIHPKTVEVWNRLVARSQA